MSGTDKPKRGEVFVRLEMVRAPANDDATARIMMLTESITPHVDVVAENAVRAGWGPEETAYAIYSALVTRVFRAVGTEAAKRFVMTGISAIQRFELDQAPDGGAFH